MKTLVLWNVECDDDDDDERKTKPTSRECVSLGYFILQFGVNVILVAHFTGALTHHSNREKDVHDECIHIVHHVCAVQMFQFAERRTQRIITN